MELILSYLLPDLMSRPQRDRQLLITGTGRVDWLLDEPIRKPFPRRESPLSQGRRRPALPIAVSRSSAPIRYSYHQLHAAVKLT